MCSSYFFSIKKEVVAVRISAYVGPQVQKIMFFFHFLHVVMLMIWNAFVVELKITLKVSLDNLQISHEG